MNLAGVDLNLLLVFDAVMTERNVTRAANRLGMTQPAVSNALNRLRLTVKDELFLRGPDGMRPTPRALELALPIRESLQRLEQALDPQDFDPSTTTRVFRAGMAEHFSALMLQKIIERMRREAPQAKLHTLPLTRLNVTERLDSGDVDVVFAGRLDLEETYGRQQLYQDRFLVAMRRDHPLAAQYESLTLPLAILLIVPMSLMSALFGVWLTGGDNNIFTQIGFMVLVGLSAKNAILIVEFARELEHQGRTVVQAAIEASRLRLRPILMTSIAFIMGVVPLVTSTGAGAEMRHAMGVAVFAGMIGVTVFGLLLTPVFYVLLRRLVGAGKESAPERVEGEAVAAHS